MSRALVRTFIDSDLREAWELRFGGYASLSWVLETAMRGVLEASAGNPTFADEVKDAIKSHVSAIKHNQPRPMPNDQRSASGA